MARATWSGFLSFGLVSVPVGLFAATADQTIHFNQLHEGTSNRVRYKKTDEETGDELTTEEIVNGFPVGGGEYIVVTPEEMKGAAPGKSDLIEIQDFVDLSDIDPIFYRQTYYLAPKGKGADRAYTLLLQAMRETGKVGIATLVLRDKEHLVAVRPGEQVLILETMFFEDEILNPQEELDTLPEADHADTRELKVAKQLVVSLSDKWTPTRYKNTYRQRVEELVEKKRAGHAVVFSDDVEGPTSNVIDLMSALKASIAKSGSGRRTPSRTSSQSTVKKVGISGSTSSKLQPSFVDMSKSELLAQAKKMKLDVTTKTTKPELVKTLRAAEKAPVKPRRRVS
jgi:DNA end-binding protein Ku